jgi:hypothetical protein
MPDTIRGQLARRDTVLCVRAGSSTRSALRSIWKHFGMLSCGRLPSASFLADENAKLIHDENVTRVDSRAGIGPSVNGAVAAISDTPGTVVALGLFLTRWNDEHKGATAEPADAALGEWHYSMR